MKFYAAVACLFTILSVPAHAGDAYSSLASQLFGNPVKGVGKVAIMPFASAQSTGVIKGGLVIAGRLGSAIAATRNVKVLDGGRVEKVLAGTSFRPELLPGGAEPARLQNALGADAAVYGVFSEMGGGDIQIKAQLVIFPGGAKSLTGTAMAVRDWETQAPAVPAAVRADLRQSLRALAAQAVPIKETAEWSEFTSAMSATLQGRERNFKLTGSKRAAEAELDAWRGLSGETVRKAYLPCAPAACAALGAVGSGYYKAYYSDGFTLKLDDAGSVLDLSYPDWKARRSALRVRAARFRPLNLRLQPDWKALSAPLEKEIAKSATPQEEAGKWTFGPADTFSGVKQSCGDRPAFCAGHGITSADYYRFNYADGFTLVLEGVRAVDCYYTPLEETK